MLTQKILQVLELNNKFADISYSQGIRWDSESQKFIKQTRRSNVIWCNFAELLIISTAIPACFTIIFANWINRPHYFFVTHEVAITILNLGVFSLLFVFFYIFTYSNEDDVIPYINSLLEFQRRWLMSWRFSGSLVQPLSENNFLQHQKRKMSRIVPQSTIDKQERKIVLILNNITLNSVSISLFGATIFMVIGVDPLGLAARPFLTNEIKDSWYWITIRFVLAQICYFESNTQLRNCSIVASLIIYMYNVCLEQLRSKTQQHYSSIRCIMLFNQLQIIHNIGRQFLTRILTVYFHVVYVLLINFFVVSIMGYQQIPQEIYWILPYVGASFLLCVLVASDMLINADTVSRHVLRKWGRELGISARSNRLVTKRVRAIRPIHFRYEGIRKVGRETVNRYLNSVLIQACSTCLSINILFP